MAQQLKILNVSSVVLILFDPNLLLRKTQDLNNLLIIVRLGEYMAQKKQITPKKSQKDTSQKENTQKNKSSDLGTNIFATLSLIFGIVFFVPFAPILAIIFGFIGLNQIKTSGEQGKGLAIAGIILGFFWLIIFLIILVLIIMALTFLASHPIPPG